MTEISPGNPRNQVNFASSARRQPGSTFKTIVLTTAIAQGISPSTTYLSAPFKYDPTETGSCDTDPPTAWCPETYDHSYVGGDLDRERNAALRQHRIRAADARRRPGEHRGHGAQRSASRTDSMRSEGAYVPSMGLGSRVVTPMDMASVYSTLAAGGIYSKPMAIRKVVLPGRQGGHGGRLGRAAAQARDSRLGRRRGRAHPRGEHDERHRCRRLLRQDVGRARRDDRQLRGRLVLRLHARRSTATVWIGYPRGRDPDDVRARHLRSRARRSRPRSGSCSWSAPSTTRRSRKTSRRRRPRRSGRRTRSSTRWSGGYYTYVLVGPAQPAGRTTSSGTTTATASSRFLTQATSRRLALRLRPRRSRSTSRPAPFPTAGSFAPRGSATSTSTRASPRRSSTAGCRTATSSWSIRPVRLAVFLPPAAFGDSLQRCLQGADGVVRRGDARARRAAARAARCVRRRGFGPRVLLLALSPIALGPDLAQHLRRVARAPDACRTRSAGRLRRSSRLRAARCSRSLPRSIPSFCFPPALIFVWRTAGRAACAAGARRFRGSGRAARRSVPRARAARARRELSSAGGPWRCRSRASAARCSRRPIASVCTARRLCIEPATRSRTSWPGRLPEAAGAYSARWRRCWPCSLVAWLYAARPRRARRGLPSHSPRRSQASSRSPASSRRSTSSGSLPFVVLLGPLAWALTAAALVLAQVWFFHYADVFALGGYVWLVAVRDLLVLALFGRRALALRRHAAEDEDPVFLERRVASPGSVVALRAHRRRQAARNGRRSRAASRRRRSTLRLRGTESSATGGVRRGARRACSSR